MRNGRWLSMILFMALLSFQAMSSGAVVPFPTSVSPNRGTPSGGTGVAISGGNFITSGTTRVTFGGTNATSVHVYSNGYGAVYITCATPAHAQGLVDVVVINPDGTPGTLYGGYTYDSPPDPVHDGPRFHDDNVGCVIEARDLLREMHGETGRTASR